MMISIPKVFFHSLIALTLLLMTSMGRAQQVVGVSEFLQSTNADEIDGWSETDMDYETAYYYDAAAVGYLFQGQTEVDARASQAGNPWAGVETTSSVRQGSVYTVYSEHYLIAYYTYSDGTYYNPYEYPGGSNFTSPGGGDSSGTGYGSGGGLEYITEEDIYLGYTYFQTSTAPPSIARISPNSDVQGSTGTIHVQGQNLRDDLGVLNAAFRDGDISVTVAPNPSSTVADLSYTVSSTAVIGAHQLVLSNTWGESEPKSFTVLSSQTSGGGGVLNPQQASCPSMLDQHSGFSSVAFIGAGNSSSGSVTVSFSGGSFDGNSVSVPYGPYSTPESIASHVATLITKQYARSGLTAKAIGADILYKTNTTLGNANFAILATSGVSPSFTANPSPLSCPKINLAYVLIVTSDSVHWVSGGMDNGRQVAYELSRWKTPSTTVNRPPMSSSRIFEHLTTAMAYGNGNGTPSDTIGAFCDVLGNTSKAFGGVYISDRYFTGTYTDPQGVTYDLGRLATIDNSGKPAANFVDQIRISLPNGPSILNNYVNPDGTPKFIAIPQTTRLTSGPCFH